MVNTRLEIAPIPVKHAVRFVTKTHRRLPHAHHRMWAIGLWVSDQLSGVALVGAPKARELAATTGEGEQWPRPYNRLEVVRVAVQEHVPNGCSKLYGACARAARGMGVTDLLKHLHEALDEVLVGNCKKFISLHIEKALEPILELEETEVSGEATVRRGKE